MVRPDSNPPWHRMCPKTNLRSPPPEANQTVSAVGSLLPRVPTFVSAVRDKRLGSPPTLRPVWLHIGTDGSLRGSRLHRGFAQDFGTFHPVLFLLHSIIMIKLLPAVILFVLAQCNQIDLKESISMIPAWKKLEAGWCDSRKSLCRAVTEVPWPAMCRPVCTTFAHSFTMCHLPLR